MTQATTANKGENNGEYPGVKNRKGINNDLEVHSLAIFTRECNSAAVLELNDHVTSLLDWSVLSPLLFTTRQTRHVISTWRDGENNVEMIFYVVSTK